jgi:ubiquilin
MGPQARQMLQSPEFIRSMTDPETLRQMARFQRLMGMGPFGSAGGGHEAFPAPGVTNTTDPENRAAQNTTDGQNQEQNPFAALMGGMGGRPNPFLNIFGGDAPQQNASNPSDTASPGSQNQQNPFAALFGNPQQGANPSALPPNLLNLQATPEMMQAASQMLGSANQNADPAVNPYANLMNIFGGGMGNFGGPPDNRPPEERYATQLGQLNQMGFHDFDRNIQALRRSGGDINGALEWLFSQPGS